MGEKKYFYVTSDYGIDDMSEQTIHQVSIDDINSLAGLAVTLDAKPEDKESFGYAAALNLYMSQNEHALSDSYNKLNSSGYGKTFLCTVIDLLLLEQRFRNSGLSEKSLDLYDQYIKKYQHELKFNKVMYHSDEAESKKL